MEVKSFTLTAEQCQSKNISWFLFLQLVISWHVRKNYYRHESKLVVKIGQTLKILRLCLEYVLELSLTLKFYIFIVVYSENELSLHIMFVIHHMQQSIL